LWGKKLSIASLNESFSAVADEIHFRRITNAQHFRIGIGGDTANVRAGLERLSDALDEFTRR